MYYNPEGKKSNINIFTGKATKYNNQILKILIWGYKSTMEIANLLSPDNPKTAFSVIARKGGALDRLQKMGFIERNPDKTWAPTIKGLLHGTLLYLEGGGSKEELLFLFHEQKVAEKLTAAWQKIITPLLKIYRKKDLLRLKQKLTNPTIIFDFVEEYKKILIEGGDVKKATNHELQALIASRIMFKVSADLTKQLYDVLGPK